MTNWVLQGWVDLSTLEIPFQVLTTLAVFARIGTRIFVLRKLFLDDIAILVAYSCSLATYIIFKIVLGLISEDFETGHFDFGPIAKFVKAAAVLYVFAMLFLKVSLGAFFLRIFTAHPMQRTVIYVLIALTAAYSMVLAVMSGATCGAGVGLLGSTSSCPIWKAYSGVSISWSVMNTLGDLLLAGLAVNALWAAQLRTPTKIIASLILTLGTFGGIASIVRLSFIAKDNLEGGITVGIMIAKWTAIEMSAGITAASLACLRPLLLLIRNSFRWLYGTGPSLYEISRAQGGMQQRPMGTTDQQASDSSTEHDQGKELLTWGDQAGAPAAPEPVQKKGLFGFRRLENSVTTSAIAIPPAPRTYGVLPDPAPR